MKFYEKILNFIHFFNVESEFIISIFINLIVNRKYRFDKNFMKNMMKYQKN